MNRDEWYRKRAAQVVANAPPTALKLFASGLREKASSETEATACLYVCSRYAGGMTVDEISAALHRSALVPLDSRASEVTHDAVLPLVQSFMLLELMPDEYWSVDKWLTDFLEYRVSTLLNDQVDSASIAAELHGTWGVERHSTVELILSSAHAVARGTSLPPEMASLGPSLRAQLRDKAIVSEFEQAADLDLPLCQPGLAERPDLQIGLRAVRLFSAIKAALDNGRLGERKLATLIAQVRPALRNWLETLTLAETELLAPRDHTRALIEECVRRTPTVKTAEHGRVALLPDRVDGDLVIPHWVTDYFFEMGGRFSHNAVGPLPYCMVLLERGESQSVHRVGLHEVDARDDCVKIPVSIQDDPSDPLTMEFSFDLEEPGHVRHLLLMLCTGGFLMDVFRMRGSAQVVHEGRTFLNLPPDARERVRAVASETLRSRHENSAVIFLRHYAESMRRDFPEIGFHASENAKAWRLGMLATRIPAKWLTGPHGHWWRRLDAARDAQLCAEVDRIELLDEGQASLAGEASLKAREHDAKFNKALQRLRFEANRDVRNLELRGMEDDLLSILGSPKRAFVHLAFSRGRLRAVWGRNARGAPEYGECKVEDFDTDRGIDLTNQWINAPHDAREHSLEAVLEYVGSTVMGPLSRELRAIGVRELVISPSWFLEVLPLHAAPTHANGRTASRVLDEFEQVTYAPSMRLLWRIARLGQVRGHGAFVFGDGESGLTEVVQEASALRDILTESGLSTVMRTACEDILAASSGNSIVHFACHGDWWPNDGLRSALVIGSGPRRRVVSAARVLRQGSFQSTALVSLAACNTGLHLQLLQRDFKEFMSLDAAFLARGARCVVSSLWLIDDLVARTFSTMMYADLVRHWSPGRAYTRALTILRDGSIRAAAEEFGVATAAGNALRRCADELAASGVDTSELGLWSPFRCSGLPWRAFVA